MDHLKSFLKKKSQDFDSSKIKNNIIKDVFKKLMS